METKKRKGQFEVIDSFAIKRKNEFYLIGQIKEGTAEKNWFVNIPFNKSLSMTLRITSIEEIEMASDENKYNLLIVTGDSESLEFFLALKIGSELLDITIEGKD